MGNPMMTCILMFLLFKAVALASQAQSSSNPSTLKLDYHKGPLLAAPINVYLTWYGKFTPAQQNTITDFFASFDPSSTEDLKQKPTVSSWWKTTQGYKDASGKPVSSTVKLAGHSVDEECSIGTKLNRTEITYLVKENIAKKVFSFDPNGVYLVLTASEVTVERFCMGSCGFHESDTVSGKKRAVVAHVGDPTSQCPGLCSWPFAVQANGPPMKPLVAPNGIGIDGMIMNIATVITGAATNPTGNGYFQGDKLAPLEAVSACPGIFGTGAYPGYPGKLMVDPKKKASFNAYGAKGRSYLVPAMWDPLTLTCKA